MGKNSVRTTKEMAELAAKILNDKRYGEDAKALAASVLVNRKKDTKKD